MNDCNGSVAALGDKQQPAKSGHTWINHGEKWTVENLGGWRVNSLKLVVGVLALVFWFSSFFVWKYFDAHGLRTPDPQSGKIYPLDTHGSVVYLTFHEHYFLYGLIIAGIVFFLLSVVFYFVGRKRL